MTEFLEVAAAEVVPDRAAVLENQGVPPTATLGADAEAAYERALEVFVQTAEPQGVLSEVSAADFRTVYAGEGHNDARTPVGDIYALADRLVLFAVTIGERVSARIQELFAAHDFALGAMLDSAASAAADKLAEVAQSRGEAVLRSGGWSRPDGGVLRYSPGYCGWHVSGQKRLFEFLQPERVGIRLTDSCLMQPLKSVSGVIVAGSRDLHRLPMDYACCSGCKTHGCQERVQTLMAG